MRAVAVGTRDPTGMDRRSELNKGKPLAEKSTLNRLELTPLDAAETSPYKKIVASPESRDNLFVDVFFWNHINRLLSRYFLMLTLVHVCEQPVTMVLPEP